MSTKVSGNLTEDARLIIFDETTGSIEHNELTSSGIYEITGLSDNDKTVIARNSSGESYGYGLVTGAPGSTGTMSAWGGKTSSYELNGTIYKLHRFLSDDTFHVTEIEDTPQLDYLVVGGGGGGGWAQSTGGAGGWVVNGQLDPSIQNYSVIVGDGGDGGTSSSNRGGKRGGDSSFGTITASGGSGGYTNSTTGPSGNGYSGGAKWTEGDYRVCCGGGAGSGADGGDGSSAGGGAGGDGMTHNITGVNTNYAGGGGGGCYTNTGTDYLGGDGGLGGGGQGGGAYTHTNPDDGEANTGGGGGGGSQGPSQIRAGADGGSGVVAVRYEAKNQSAPSIPYHETFDSYPDGSDPNNIDYFGVHQNDGVDTAQIVNDGQGTAYIEIDSDKNSDTYYYLRFDYRLVGDFDIRLTTKMITRQNPSSSLHYSMFRVVQDGDNQGRISMVYGGALYAYIQSYYQGTNTENIPDTNHNDNPMKFRITRTSGKINYFYWDDTRWEWKNNTDGLEATGTFNDPMLIYLTYKQESNKRWRITWDDFEIVSVDGLQLV